MFKTIEASSVKARPDQFAAAVGAPPLVMEALRREGGEFVRGTPFIFLEHIEQAFAGKSGVVTPPGRRDTKKRTKREPIVVALRQRYRRGVPPELTVKEVGRACQTDASERTISRALDEYKEELKRRFRHC